MTIQLLHPYNGNRPGIYSSMGSTEEARLVGLGLARYWTDGIDGKNTQFSEAEKAAGQALVSRDGINGNVLAGALGDFIINSQQEDFMIASTFAALPAASQNSGRLALVTDRNNAVAYCNGTIWFHPQPWMFYGKNPRVTRTFDGTAADIVMAELLALTIPADVVGTAGGILVRSYYKMTGTGQQKDFAVNINGSSIGSPSAAASSLAFGCDLRLIAEGATNDQYASNAGATLTGAGTNAALERTFDTTAALALSIQTKLAVAAAAHTTQLTWAEVWIFPTHA